MNRREFLKRLGVSAAAVSFLELPTAPVQVIDPPMVPATGWSGGEMLRVGDVFTIAGKNAINPLTGAETELLQNFVVTAVDDGAETVEIWPSMRTPTERWFDSPMVNPRDLPITPIAGRDA